MANQSTRRECPYCASEIQLGECPIVATSFSGAEFRGAEEFDLTEVELYSGQAPRRLLPKTNWPVLREAPLRDRVAAIEAQRGSSSIEQAFSEFREVTVADAPLPPLLEDGLAREDVPARACPVCEFPLPQSIDQRPAIVIAVVGVNRVGKTHLLASSLTEAYRYQGLASRIGCSEFVPDESTGKRFKEDYYERLFRHGEILEPTQVDPEEVRFQPLVFNVTLQNGGPFSLVLHDVAGEVLGDHQMRARGATYLQGARGIVFVVDPRDIDDLRDGIPALMPDEDDLGWDQGTLLAACLQPDGLVDRRRRIPVAIAIAKADLLPQVTGESLPFLERADDEEGEEDFFQRVRASSAQVREFLERHRAHNILGPAASYERELQAAGGQAAVTFHAFSALGDTPAKIEQGSKVQPINALDPLAAILSQI